MNFSLLSILSLFFVAFQSTPALAGNWCISDQRNPPCGGAAGRCIQNFDGSPGGFVASTAALAPTAYLGQFASVCESAQVQANARVWENARVAGTAIVYGQARVNGNAQIYGNARVAENAKVLNFAQVRDEAQVFGDATVYERAMVAKHARVFGNAWIAGNTRISDFAQISGNAKIFGSATVYGQAIVTEGAKVYGNAWVCQNAKILGNAQIGENARVFGDAIISGDARVGGTQQIAATTRLPAPTSQPRAGQPVRSAPQQGTRAAVEVTVPTVHFIPGKSDTAAPQADIQSAETERQRLEQLHREIDEMQRQREKQEAKEARHKALREKKREEEKARKPGAMGPIEDGPSRHRPDRPDLDLGDRGAKLGEEAARRDETDKQAYGDRQGKQDADRKRDKGEEEEETNRIMVRTTTGHLFERIDHLKPTGMSGPKMMAFRQMGEIWKDPKGLYWSNRIQNSDGSVRLLSQPDAKKFCEDRGGRLPWMSEYVNLRHWMGGGSWPELTREYAKGYTPQIFSFFTDRTDVEYPLWVNHTKPAPDSGWGMPRAEYFWFYPFDGFAISGNYTQKEMQENASRNFRGELNKYDTKVWQAAQCVFL